MPPVERADLDPDVAHSFSAATSLAFGYFRNKQLGSSDDALMDAIGERAKVANQPTSSSRQQAAEAIAVHACRGWVATGMDQDPAADSARECDEFWNAVAELLLGRTPDDRPTWPDELKDAMDQAGRVMKQSQSAKEAFAEIAARAIVWSASL